MNAHVPLIRLFLPRIGFSPVVVGRRLVGGGLRGARKGC